MVSATERDRHYPVNKADRHLTATEMLHVSSSCFIQSGSHASPVVTEGQGHLLMWARDQWRIFVRRRRTFRLFDLFSWNEKKASF